MLEYILRVTCCRQQNREIAKKRAPAQGLFLSVFLKKLGFTMSLVVQSFYIKLQVGNLANCIHTTDVFLYNFTEFLVQLFCTIILRMKSVANFGIFRSHFWWGLFFVDFQPITSSSDDNKMFSEALKILKILLKRNII